MAALSFNRTNCFFYKVVTNISKQNTKVIPFSDLFQIKMQI